MPPKVIFTVLKTDPACPARTGVMDLPHCKVMTPVFMPVGTNATVKAVSKDSLDEIGFEIILANTYHLFLRPGHELIREAGGLHGFTGWKGNFRTDSGGFQVFSLSKLRRISEEGVKFQSHLDGSSHFLSPELAVDIQTALNSDIFMQLDVCTPWGASHADSLKALTQTTSWAARSVARWEETRGDFQGNLFGIIQGNFHKDLRERSAFEILALDTPGIAIGGLSVGEPFEVFAEFLAHTASLLPNGKPRYVMGIGTPEYILEAVHNGIDMFDCVFPTRTARNGLLFTAAGPISIKQARYKKDFVPPDPRCTCKVCRDYSRAYLHHLYKNNEILYSMLASYHNLAFLHEFMKRIRYSIEEGTFIDFKRDFLPDILPSRKPDRMRFSRRCLRFMMIVSIASVQPFSMMTVLAEETAASAANAVSRRLDILRFGIESQVMELLSTLAREKNDDFKVEILKVFDASASPKLRASILDYMGTLALDSASDRAVELIKNRDEESDSLVVSAFSYLLQIKSVGALAESLAIVKADEKRYLNAAVRMIGAVGVDGDAMVLKDLYEADGTDDAVKEQVVLALGTMKAKSSFELLSGIASSPDASMALRMYACSALGELGDPLAIPVLVGASAATVPNVRSSAVAALGNFSDAKARNAVREALRDSHVLVRVAAAKSAAKTADEEAIPYLEFKSSEDPEKSVREASIEALAAIGGKRAESFLSEFVADGKKPAQYRGAAFGALVKHGRKSEMEKLESSFKTAQAEKDRTYFTILAKTLVAVDVSDAEPFIAILLDDKDYQMRLGAIAWIDRNKNKDFIAQLRVISETDTTEAVKRRAAQALERMEIQAPKVP